MASFEARKAKLMRQLDLPAELYHDASPKGSVDENIQDLVAEINGMEDFVTTSSCGGRIAVYAEGSSKGSASGKGGGRWLFISHLPIPHSDLDDLAKLPQTLGVPCLTNDQKFQIGMQHDGISDSRFVHFKFEPLILHVLTKSNEAAQKLLAAAMDAGYRESGISGVASSNPNKPITPMVAIRTAGLGFDCIVASQSDSPSSAEHAPSLRPMVTADYLHTIVQIANKRFEMNEQRKDRFRTALQVRFPASFSDKPGR